METWGVYDERGIQRARGNFLRGGLEGALGTLLGTTPEYSATLLTAQLRPHFAPDGSGFVSDVHYPVRAWIPSTMPPFRGIEVGTDGRIWVRRNTHPIQIAADERADRPPPVGWAQPLVYDLFEADGTFLGEVRFPERFEPHLFGTGYVWGVRRGDLGEEHIVRLSMK